MGHLEGVHQAFWSGELQEGRQNMKSSHKKCIRALGQHLEDCKSLAKG
jgi:hypothetical protein